MHACGYPVASGFGISLSAGVCLAHIILYMATKCQDLAAVVYGGLRFSLGFVSWFCFSKCHDCMLVGAGLGIGVCMD
jgi:hypothetical protein